MKTPTAIETWINIFPYLENQDWGSIYKRIFNITKEPYLQSFQYKIINRVLNCKDKLFKWKILETNMCLVCKDVDGVEHHLFYCIESKKF